MKQAKKILYISQEISPYLPDTRRSLMGRHVPETMLENGNEVRIFMPRFGNINQRRNQLHEVIRLSGMNVIVDDTDHTLMLKVASLQPSRLQIYFIDNEEYFQRKHTVSDENGEEFPDNDERIIFFVRGVMETIKKLRWTPDVIHCQGWMTALAPLYIKKVYNQDPFFKDAKVIYSVLDDDFYVPLRTKFAENLIVEGIKKEHIKHLKGKEIDFASLTKVALDFSDGIISAAEIVDKKIADYISKKGLAHLPYSEKENYVEDYALFYDSL